MRVFYFALLGLGNFKTTGCLVWIPTCAPATTTQLDPSNSRDLCDIPTTWVPTELKINKTKYTKDVRKLVLNSCLSTAYIIQLLINLNKSYENVIQKAFSMQFEKIILN